MLVAGIDASTNATGIAIMENGKLDFYCLIDLHKEKDGHTSYYNAVLIPFEYDICQDTVEFHVSGIREFQRQLNKYYRGCQRPVNRE